MNKVFEPTQNHFPKLLIFEGQPLQNAVWIQDVVHQAKIIVDEKGTEAAAATGIIVGADTSAPPQPKLFHVDHPALLFIYDKKFNSILFMGRLADPIQK